MINKYLVVMLGAALSVSAQATIQEGTQFPSLTPKKSTLKYSATAQSVTNGAAVKADAPASLTGKNFVTLFNDGDYDMNAEFTVAAAANDSVLLEGFAQGYDVKAAYNATTGKLTIPTGMVIGQQKMGESTMCDVTLHALVGQQYNDTEITGTVSGDTITFDKGVYCTFLYNETKYYNVLMQELSAVKSNATMTMTLVNGTTEIMPVTLHMLATRTGETEISIIGLSNLLYSQRYSVPFSFDKVSNKAILSSGQPIDFEITSTGARNIYYVFSSTSEGLVRNPQFNIVAGDASSLTADGNLFIGYDTNGQGSYKGLSFTKAKITVDFNIYTAEIVKPALPTEATVDGIIYSLDNEKDEALVTGALGTLTDLNIPATIKVGEKTFAVMGVDAQAFQGNRKITAVHIPASMKKVGTDAFRNMSNLKSVYIADLAAWCAIDFANGNANPIYNAFSSYRESAWGNVYVNNEAVTKLVIPEGVTTIGRSFYGFKKLTNVTLPSSLRTLGDQAFGNCEKITEIALPEGLDSIGSAFWSCIGIEKIVLPSTVKKLGSNTFYGCKALKDITLNEGLETIGRMTFSSCAALTTISFPATLKSIGMMALYGCSNVTSVTSLATVPPATFDNAFEDVVEKAALYVPEASIAAYKAADGWKTFKTVSATTPSAVEGIDIDNDAEAVYFNLQGMKVGKNDLKAGIYVKVVNGKSTKVAVF